MLSGSLYIIMLLFLAPGKPDKPIVQAVNGSILNVTFTLPENYVGDIPNKFRVFYYKKESKWYSYNMFRCRVARCEQVENRFYLYL